MSSSPEKSLIETSGTHNLQEKASSTIYLKDGKLSWIVCACGFFSRVCILCLLNSFGVFFVELSREFGSSKSETAWVASIGYGLSLTFGPVASFLQNRYTNRLVMMTGALICAISLLVSSFSTSLLQMMFLFSLFYGFGTCLVVSPTMTFAQDYFHKHLGTAVGLITSGSSVGTLVGNPLSHFLISKGGWRTAFRFYAGACLFTVVCCSQIKPLTARKKSNIQRLKESPLKRLMQELKLWKNRVFVVWTIAISCVMFGIYVPYVLLVPYSIDVGIPDDKSFILMTVLGFCTATGRILFGKIVSLGILNQLQMHQLSMVIFGGGIMLLPLISSFNGLMVYTSFLGLVDGCYSVLVPLLTASLVGPENAVLAWGFLIGTNSLTFIMGPPVAGAIADATGSYNASFHCAGVPVLIGASLLFFIPWAQRTSTTNNIIEVIREGPPSDEAFTPIKGGSTGDDIELNDITLDDEQTPPSVRSSSVSVSTQTISYHTLECPYRYKFSQTESFCQVCKRRQQPTEMDDALSQLHHNANVLSRMLDEDAKNDLTFEDMELMEKRRRTNNIMITSASQVLSSPHQSQTDEHSVHSNNFSKASSRPNSAMASHQSIRSTAVDSENSNQFFSQLSHLESGCDLHNPTQTTPSQLSNLAPNFSRDSKSSVGVTDQSSRSNYSSMATDSQFDIVIRNQVEKIRDSLQSPSSSRDGVDDIITSPPGETAAVCFSHSGYLTKTETNGDECVSPNGIPISPDRSTVNNSKYTVSHPTGMERVSISSSVDGAVPVEKAAHLFGSNGFMSTERSAGVPSGTDRSNPGHTMEPPTNFTSPVDDCTPVMPSERGETSLGLFVPDRPAHVERELNSDSFVFVDRVMSEQLGRNTENAAVLNGVSEICALPDTSAAGSTTCPVACPTNGDQDRQLACPKSEIDVFTHLFTDD